MRHRQSYESPSRTSSFSSFLHIFALLWYILIKLDPSIEYLHSTINPIPHVYWLFRGHPGYGASSRPAHVRLAPRGIGMAFTQIRRFHANNVAVLRKSPLSEISGSLGDLGTLLPLMIALAVNNSISLSTTLVFSGLWNIFTGVAFGIPLPVQPMKVSI